MNGQAADILEVCFTGPDLDGKSIPIYDLGEVLITIQRIVNKSYLVQNNLWNKNARLSVNDPNLTLQLMEHHTGPDTYHLTWFSDVLRWFSSDLSNAILLDGVKWVAAYTQQDVIERTRVLVTENNPESKKEHCGLLAIYPEMLALTNRIEGVDKRISEIRLNLVDRHAPVTINIETKRYVRSLTISD